MQAKTKKKGIIERLSILGLSISYTGVLKLSTVFYINMKNAKLSARHHFAKTFSQRQQ